MGVPDLRGIFARVRSLSALRVKYILDLLSTQWLVLMRMSTLVPPAIRAWVYKSMLDVLSRSATSLLEDNFWTAAVGNEALAGPQASLDSEKFIVCVCAVSS